MNKLKSYFVMGYLMIAVAIILGSLYQLVFHGLSPTWVGTMLTTLPFIGLFVWSYFKHTPRTSPRLPFLTVITLAGLGLAGYGYLTEEPPRHIGFTMAVIGAAGFLLFTNWYSVFNRRINSKLVRGAGLPVFEVVNQDGKPVSSDILLGKPALLLFYRGNWCPICMAHVDEVLSRYRELIDRDVQVALISPQPPDLVRRVADLYDVPFNFWVDVDAKAAKTLDILSKDGVPVGARKTYGTDTVLPTAIIIDAESKIIFTDQTDNYRVRPDPDLFIEALAAHGY